MDAQLARAKLAIEGAAVPRRVDPQTRSLLKYMFAATRGGRSRLCIVGLLLENRLNRHQLARAVGMDYKAVEHHLRVMEKNRLVERDGDGYGCTYRASALLEHGLHELVRAADALGRRAAPKKYY